MTSAELKHTPERAAVLADRAALRAVFNDRIERNARAAQDQDLPVLLRWSNDSSRRDFQCMKELIEDAWRTQDRRMAASAPSPEEP